MANNESPAVSSRLRLNFQDIERAIFLDYEGNMDMPPTLLGWRVDGELFAVIVEPLFKTCQHRYRARHVIYKNHKGIISDLIGRAVRENRHIVTWSMHDLRVMQSVVGDSHSGKLATVYRNALATGRPWYRNTHGQRAEVASLSHFSDLFGLKVPDRFGSGVVGTALGHIRSQLKEGRVYANLTPKARKGWVSVVRHNEYDLINMEKVLRAIARS